MNYFLNESVFTLNSGTEFSAIKRLQLFKKNGQPAKILTRNYNSNSAADIERVGLESSDVLNMYDYFQEVTDQPRVNADVRYIDVFDKNLYHIEAVDANESMIKFHGRVIAKVSIAPATVGLVGTIDWYNDNKVVVARDVWDRRGFKSSTQYYHPDGSLGPQVFFNAQGQPKIELTHMNINGVLAPTSWKLLDYSDKVLRFNTEEDLFAFFASELAAKEPSSFICDRPTLTSAMLKIENAAGKWQFLHNTHAADNRQAGASRKLVPYLEPLFNNWVDQIDGLIVPTNQQREEILRYYKFKRVLVLPDTYAENVENASVQLSQAREQTIICLGMISANKGSVEAVDILARVREKMPNVKLEFYGYASPMDYRQAIEKRAEALNSKEFVTFPGYKSEHELAKILEKGGVLLSTSEGEAFGMGILKGMSYGLPVVAYKVKYGLTEMIKNGKDGNLVPFRSEQAAAEAILKILSNPEIQAAYSKAAYERAQYFNAERAWQLWEEAGQQVNNLLVKA
ncbi:MAG: accessory Sec system glycosyltransferase Asp1 [Streptococcaceae bacterium]|jgi:poly(glycerol-phosphate) alpha-glucosyltransferase|nr:accessory Sec system glycosyltransferase Asp1 [Streptococcaceae bacterium]